MNAIIYGDYVCPFCFLEIPALERLRDEHGVLLDFRAFELRPDPIPTLDPRGEYLTTTWDRSVYPMAQRLGVPIKLPPVQPRSRLAFEGAELARDAGKLTEYTKAVYSAFFQDGQDIGDVEVLARIAGKVGLDVNRYREALADHRYVDRVLEQETEAAQIGISGVPAVIIGDYLVSGCVPYEHLVRALEAAKRSADPTGVARA